MHTRAANTKEASAGRRGAAGPSRDLDTPTLRNSGKAPPDFAGARGRPILPGRIEPIGAPRLASRCACGGGCARCRNPDDASGSGPTPMTRPSQSCASPASVVSRDGTEAIGGEAGGSTAGGGASGTGAGSGAAPARRARLRSGPRYTPNGNLAPNVVGGVKNVPFNFDAVFDSDPANGIFPGCGEIHQDIKWDAAAATNGNTQWGLSVPHGGFPAAHPANTWIEDRDTADTRYGRRAGAHSAPGPGDQYTDSTGTQDEARGAAYHGQDNPSNVPAAFAGRWSFMVLAFDMCNGGTQIGSADFIVIDW